MSDFLLFSYFSKKMKIRLIERNDAELGPWVSSFIQNQDLG